MKKTMKNVFILLLAISMLFGITAPEAYASAVDDNTEISSEEHNYQEVIEKATTSKNGSVIMKCVDCGQIDSTAGYTIYRPKTVKLSKNSYVYTGKVIKPSVTVIDSAGKVIDSSNYAVSYKSNKNVGTATVVVTFCGDYYKGTMKKSFSIKPKVTSIKSISSIKNGFSLKWNKQDKQVSGYQIQYAKNSGFKKAKSVSVLSKNADRNAIMGLSKNTKYFVRIRTYQDIEVDGKTKRVYSEWSKNKTVTTQTASSKVSSKECPYPIETVIDEGGHEVYFYFLSYQDQEFTDTWKQCEDILSSRSTEFNYGSSKSCGFTGYYYNGKKVYRTTPHVNM